MSDKKMEAPHNVDVSPYTSLVGRSIRHGSHAEPSLHIKEGQDHGLEKLNGMIVSLYEKLRQEIVDDHSGKVVTHNDDGTYTHFYFYKGGSMDDPQILMKQASEYKDNLGFLDTCLTREVRINFLSKKPDGRKIVQNYNVDIAKLSGATPITYHNFRDEIGFPYSAGLESEVIVSRIENVISPFIKSLDNPRVNSSEQDKS